MEYLYISSEKPTNQIKQFFYILCHGSKIVENIMLPVDLLRVPELVRLL